MATRMQVLVVGASPDIRQYVRQSVDSVDPTIHILFADGYESVAELPALMPELGVVWVYNHFANSRDLMIEQCEIFAPLLCMHPRKASCCPSGGTRVPRRNIHARRR